MEKTNRNNGNNSIKIEKVEKVEKVWNLILLILFVFFLTSIGSMRSMGAIVLFVIFRIWLFRQRFPHFHKCSKCQMVLSTKGNLKRHEKLHQNIVERLVCPVCQTTISNKWHMKVHFNRSHPRKRKFPRVFQTTLGKSKCKLTNFIHFTEFLAVLTLFLFLCWILLNLFLCLLFWFFSAL